ncbi:MAG TPA: dephospho-CoA kinase [Thermomicrobiales bacterium]|nr:dephospho-CoA kinase [Thermomicrobiales bacterium]
MPRRKHVLGITGNIACGKSVVVSMLGELGAETMDGDAMVHAMMGPGSALAPAIRARFGEATVRDDDSINRPELGKVVFSDPEALEDLEHLIHPLVVAEKRAAMYRPGPDVLVLDAIKLFEAGIAADCDEVWVVNCSRETQIERIMARNGVDRTEAERRIDAQPPQSEKVAKADVVIENDGALSDTRKQVLDAWNRLTGQDVSLSSFQPGGGTQNVVRNA